MRTETEKTNSIDEFIAGYPEDVREILEKIRMIIRNAAPKATEAMKYGIPTFVYEGNLVHFSAYKKHIGFYPAPSGIEKFKDELSIYEQAKGSVQFPLDRPIPYELIRKIVEFRVEENSGKARGKVKKRR